jgi:hypothetical protein
MKIMYRSAFRIESVKAHCRPSIDFRMTRLQPFAAVALAMVAASVSPTTAHAQEYPWCVSRESYLYCFYKTHEQCQWTASGIGGCTLNPRLLFPDKPRDSDTSAIRSKGR